MKDKLMYELNKEDVYEGFNHKEYDFDLHGWTTCSHVLERISLMKSRYLIEVGVWKGKSSIAYAGEIKKLGLDKKVISIDTFLGGFEHIREYGNTKEADIMRKNGLPQLYYQFIANVIKTGFEDTIIPIAAPSNIAAYLLRYYGISSDLIYVDGDHTKDGVNLDLKHYYNLLDENGRIYGDDWNWVSVRSGVLKFVNDNNLKVDNDGVFWWIEKQHEIEEDLYESYWP